MSKCVSAVWKKPDQQVRREQYQQCSCRQLTTNQQTMHNCWIESGRILSVMRYAACASLLPSMVQNDNISLVQTCHFFQQQQKMQRQSNFFFFAQDELRTFTRNISMLSCWSHWKTTFRDIDSSISPFGTILRHGAHCWPTQMLIILIYIIMLLGMLLPFIRLFVSCSIYVAEASIQHFLTKCVMSFHRAAHTNKQTHTAHNFSILAQMKSA